MFVLAGRAVGEDDRITAIANAMATTTPTTSSVLLLNSGRLRRMMMQLINMDTYMPEIEHFKQT